MPNVPTALGYAFGLITALTVWFLYRAAHRSRLTLSALLVWALLVALVAAPGFFTDTTTLPPRLLLLIGPPLLALALLFATARGQQYLDRLHLPVLTLLHVVRVPVELVLLGLYRAGAVPQLMTFEGRNFDILAGLTAPLVYYLAFRKKALERKGLIAWNIVCLILLLNIVANAILSAPYPFQQFAFTQPNVAVLHFPFVWLPGVVVPVVLLAHLAALRKLLTSNSLPA